jgi:3-deoxy-D-manno-octulosonic-acid transferase
MTAPPGLNILLAYQGWRGGARAEQLLERELAAGLEHPRRARERLGETRLRRPDGPLVWIHVREPADMVTVPELTGLLSRERDDLVFLVTTARHDDAFDISSQLPAGVLHQFLPYEVGPGVVSFLDHWRPDIVVWSDPDLRPRIIEAISERHIPLYMINAWMPDERQYRWRWFSGGAKTLLRRFDRILARDEPTAINIRRLGARPGSVEAAGYMQEGSVPLACDESEREALGELMATRPVWLAAGTSAREDNLVIEAHRRVMRQSHRLLLILVPDTSARGAVLAARLEADGWIIALRSLDQDPEPDVEIFIADLPDEMGLWYRLASIAFMGQTLDRGPGRNPFEAAALGSAILHGPNVSSLAGKYERLHQAGAARKVVNGEALARSVETLLAPDKAALMAAAAWEVGTRGAEVSGRICALVLGRLEELGV